MPTASGGRPQPPSLPPLPPGAVRPCRPVPDVAAYLTGRWSIERRVLDVRAGAEGSFRGIAEFRPEGADGALLHVEEGELTWADAVHQAGRRLWLRPRPDGTAEVEFADGRPFHDLDLRTGLWYTVHPCAADRYAGTFTVTGPDTWELEWRIEGPAKEAVLRSLYRRR